MSQRGIHNPIGMLLLLGLLLVGLPSARAASPEECLACHGEKEFQSDSGKSLYVDQRALLGSVHGRLSCQSCHMDARGMPHKPKLAPVNCARCHAGKPDEIRRGVHGVLGEQSASCVACHGTHAVRRPESVGTALCAACHTQEVKDYKAGVHGRSAARGNGEAARCQSCHGPTHTALAATDPNSGVSRQKLPLTCGGCHSNPALVARYHIPIARPLEAYELSVHARAMRQGKTQAAICSDCHGNHLILAAGNPAAKIYWGNVPATCGACHTRIFAEYKGSVHGRAVAAGLRDAPVCTDCHGEHDILGPDQPDAAISAARLSFATCGRCHGDERLSRKFGFPLDRLPSYADSYHGLASRSGALTVANCASCHGVHNILPSTDPRSSVSKANLAFTCGKCHADAGTRFVAGPVHVLPASTDNPWVYWIRRIYIFLIVFTIGAMVLHNGLDFFAKMARGFTRHVNGETVERMNLHFRIAHWLTMISFPVLAVTGFALKFPNSFWAEPLLKWESQFALRGTIHRVAAVILLAGLGYHFVHVAFSRRARRCLQGIGVRYTDVRDLLRAIGYNLGWSNRRPQFGKFTYGEKAEYWAYMWGSLVMTLTGFLLWFEDFALRHFGKIGTDIATLVHYYEAILATLAVIVWHLYTVMFDPEVYPMEWSWWHGKVSLDHMRHLRPAGYPPGEPKIETRMVRPRSPQEAKLEKPAMSPLLRPSGEPESEESKKEAAITTSGDDPALPPGPEKESKK